MSQTFCGSKAYAAPEILQGRTYDPMKADVWALGVIMYIFITGKMPFDETKVCPSFARTSMPYINYKGQGKGCYAPSGAYRRGANPSVAKSAEPVGGDWRDN